MCLKFDPVKQKLKQTCSGTCKNKCGFKADEDAGRTSSSSHGPKVVRIRKGYSDALRFQEAPIFEKTKK